MLVRRVAITLIACGALVGYAVLGGLFQSGPQVVAMPGDLRVSPAYEWPALKLEIEAKGYFFHPATTSTYEYYRDATGRWYIEVIESDIPRFIGDWRKYDGSYTYFMVNHYFDEPKVTYVGPNHDVDWSIMPTRANALARQIQDGYGEVVETEEEILGRKTTIIEQTHVRTSQETGAVHDLRTVVWIDPQDGFVLRVENYRDDELTGFVIVRDIVVAPDLPPGLFE